MFTKFNCREWKCTWWCYGMLIAKRQLFVVRSVYKNLNTFFMILIFRWNSLKKFLKVGECIASSEKVVLDSWVQKWILDFNFFKEMPLLTWKFIKSKTRLFINFMSLIYIEWVKAFQVYKIHSIYTYKYKSFFLFFFPILVSTSLHLGWHNYLERFIRFRLLRTTISPLWLIC